MKKKYFSLLAYILFLTVVSINPVQAEPADIVLYSFDPQDDYDCFMEYSCYAGEDMSYIAEELSNLKVNACTKNPFSASPDTVYYLQASIGNEPYPGDKYVALEAINKIFEGEDEYELQQVY